MHYIYAHTHARTHAHTHARAHISAHTHTPKRKCNTVLEYNFIIIISIYSGEAYGRMCPEESRRTYPKTGSDV